MNNVKCDKCNKVFKIASKVKKHPLGVEEMYFTCPHCKHHYTAFFSNKKIRRMQAEVSKLRNKISKSDNEKLIARWKNKMEELQSEMKAEMNKLKEKYATVT